MKVMTLAEKLNCKVVSGGDGLNRSVSGCYIGDLMSLAMAKVEEENVWITIQTNVNVVAVATLKEAGCVLLAEGAMPDDTAKQKAELEEIPLLVSEESAYSLAKKLAELGI